MQRQDRIAADIHREYRTATDNATQIFTDLKTDFPLGSFPKHAARVWKYGMLAEVWAVIATNLCNGEVNYLEQWRTGK
jgi:hypothetical protein